MSLRLTIECQNGCVESQATVHLASEWDFRGPNIDFNEVHRKLEELGWYTAMARCPDRTKDIHLCPACANERRKQK